MIDRGKDADFIECVLSLALVEIVELDLFDGVGLVVDESLGFVD